MTRLHTKQDPTSRYHQAEQFLAALDEDWHALIKLVGPCVHQPRPERDPYEALIRSVVYQQLHTRAAERILQRLIDIYPHGHCPSPEEVLATPYETLRACGLSGAKATSILGLSPGTLGRHHSRSGHSVEHAGRETDQATDHATRHRPLDRGNDDDVHAGTRRHSAGR